MKTLSVVLSAVPLLCLCSMAHANITIDTVEVGDPGNMADTRYVDSGYGSVSYTYNIGKYEVTAAQYAGFLNAVAANDSHGLYNPFMAGVDGCGIEQNGASGSYTYSVATGWENRPVNYVSFWDACRFANWLNNGQGDGDTETGAYTLAGYNDIDGSNISRNAGAKWAVTSEDEWYKAAYYKGGGVDAGYWDYTIQSNSVDSTMVNCDSSVGHTTDVGSYAYAGAYGTYDQGGNVWEWDESVLYEAGYVWRDLRGSSWRYNAYGYTHAQFHYGDSGPMREYNDVGFRVSTVVPEPSSILALCGGLVSLVGIRRRKV